MEEATISNNINIPNILASVIFFFFFLLIIHLLLIILNIKYIYNYLEYNFIGDKMKKKFSKIDSLLLPNKRINIFIICILILGVITGSIFIHIIDSSDRELIINKITTFIFDINNSNINTITSLKNSLLTNFTYVFLIWTLGMTIIGLPFNVFLVYLKGFVIGFSLSSFIILYKFKGIILAIIYLLFGQLLNIFIILVFCIYSLMFTSKLLRQIFKDRSNSILHFFKKYVLILVIGIIVTIISSLFESFLLPTIIKLMIKLYI